MVAKHALGNNTCSVLNTSQMMVNFENRGNSTPEVVERPVEVEVVRGNGNFFNPTAKGGKSSSNLCSPVPVGSPISSGVANENELRLILDNGHLLDPINSPSLSAFLNEPNLGDQTHDSPAHDLSTSDPASVGQAHHVNSTPVSNLLPVISLSLSHPILFPLSLHLLHPLWR